jgi:uncharacterized protein (TIGR02145 family)
MKNKPNFLIYELLLMGVFLLFTSSCENDDDNNGDKKVGLPVLTTTAITDIKQTTAIGGGNITSESGAMVTARGVCWSTEQTPTISDNKTTDGTRAGNYVSNISSLASGTTYYVRAYATNSTGTAYGTQVSFTTTVPATQPTVTTSSIAHITTSSAMGGGNVISKGGVSVTERGLCYSTSQNPTTADAIAASGSGTGTFSVSMAPLEPATTYYVRAYATNSVGTAYGSQMSFTTDDGSGKGSFIDSRDGNAYQTVTIGSQVWMSENLKFLPSVVGPGAGSYTTPFYYVYDYHGTDINTAKAAANYTTYGVLYNWPAATNACPVGWHLPSDEEWIQLIAYLGGADGAGGKLKEIGTAHWLNPNTGATNESGFTAFPGGMVSTTNEVFYWIGAWGFWWSATNWQPFGAGIRYMGYANTHAYRDDYFMGNGLSVRCVRD